MRCYFAPMGWTFDEFSGTVHGHRITVQARAGFLASRFLLKVNGEPQDTCKAIMGTHTLEGQLPDLTPVRVRVQIKGASLAGQEYFLEANGSETKLGEGWLL